MTSARFLQEYSRIPVSAAKVSAAVIADAAREARLDPETIVAGAHREDLRAEASAGWRRAVERDHIFGVPSFVYAGKLYWGQDRMHFLRSAVMRKSSV